MTGWLLLAALAWGDPTADTLPIPVDPALAEIWLSGQRFERQGDPASAAVAYRIVVRGDPTWTPGLLALGAAYEASGRHDDALEVYRRSSVPDVLVARARVELALGQPELALTTYARLRRADPSAEVVRLQALAEARVDPSVAEERLREWLRWLQSGPDTSDARASADLDTEAATVLAVIDALVANGDVERATSLLGDALTSRPRLLDVAALQERLDAMLLDAEARQGMRSGAVDLDADQTRRLADAEASLRVGDRDAARAVAQALVREAPRSPEAWATRARVALADGDIPVADDALQRAEFLAPTDPNYAAALGDLLATSYGGAEDAAAVEAYSRALRRDPLWDELWWRRARIEQRAGLADRGRAAFERYLDLAPEGQHAAAARQILSDLARQRPPPPPLPSEPQPPPGVSPEALLAYHRVGVLRARGDRDAALDEVRRVRALAPDFADAVNLEASLFLDVGDREHARLAWQESLRLDPDQPGVVLSLWDLLRREGRHAEADRVIADAAARGIGDVHYLLARAAWEAGRRAEARSHLAAYGTSARTGRFVEEAQDLEERLDERDRRDRTLAVTSAAAVIVGLMLWPVARWLRGPSVGLRELIERAPGATRAVVRVAAAVRHEVLKHDTTVLSDVADALESGDMEKVEWASERLFAPRGTVARFREQVAALVAIGRANGARLDLRRRDPVFGPLIAAVERLAKLRPDLERGRARAAPELRRVAYALNEVGFPALGELVQSLSLLRVDAERIEAIVRRAATEGGVGRGPAAGVVFDTDPVWVRVFQGDLEDILVNLVRNAVQASRAAGAGDIEVRVETEVDALTFLERVVISIRDRAPTRLTTAMIRERPLSRGLGIVRDRVDRSGGTLHVEACEGWSKAAVVRLPTVETAEAS